MNLSAMIQNVPCTLVTGFLGAGKTTVINQLLSNKPTHERWALLINEFGRIGIDGALLANHSTDAAQSIAIREVSGGCICCTSQLPLQIAISRLLKEHQPQRLLIEPTGLAHPHELVSQLSAAHWQACLSMQAVITVLNARQWQQEKYRHHDGFQAHVRAADVLVINRYEELEASLQQELTQWITSMNSHAHIIWDTVAVDNHDTHTDTDAAMSLATELHAALNQPSTTIDQQRAAANKQTRISLSPHAPVQAQTAAASADNIVDETLPYRYHDTQQGIQLGGWRLPAHWVFAADDLQRWLLQLPYWQRIKGVINTSDGWLQLNFTPDSLTVSSTGAQIDSRLEVILSSSDQHDSTRNTAEHTASVDWDACDRELLSLLVL